MVFVIFIYGLGSGVNKKVIATSTKVSFPVRNDFHTETATDVPVFRYNLSTSEPTITPSNGINIPAPYWNYVGICIPKNDQQRCLTSDDDPEFIISWVVYNEGGGASLQIAANLLQLLHNRMYYAWTCHSIPKVQDTGSHKFYGGCTSEWEKINPNDIPWTEITKQEYLNLALYVMAQPYILNGSTQPAWNSWVVPIYKNSDELYPDLKFKWNAVSIAVHSWLETSYGTGQTSRVPIVVIGKGGWEFIPVGALAYPQHEMQGPPFSVQTPEVQALYRNWCDVELLYTEDILDKEPNFRDKGVSRMQEQVYALKVVAPVRAANRML
jgi:hypothetical protein